MANIDTIKARVQKILVSTFNHVEIDGDGDFSFRHESARIFVRCWTPGDDRPVLVALTCPLLFDVKPTPELFKHIALHSDDYVFGHLSCTEKDGSVTVFFTHTLLGDYLDEEELLSACRGVLGTGNDLDNELQTQFGGQLFHND